MPLLSYAICVAVEITRLGVVRMNTEYILLSLAEVSRSI